MKAIKKVFMTVVLFAAIFTLVLFTGCKNDNLNKQAQTEQKNEETISNTETSKKQTKFPLDFTVDDGKGNIIDFSEYNDKLLFLNFFVTWCGPCMNEMPEFQKIYDKYNKEVGILIMNVNFDSNEKSVNEVLSWYEESGYTFPMAIDLDGSQTKDFYKYVTGYPTTFVYYKGEYKTFIPGGMNEEMMEKIINKYTE